MKFKITVTLVDNNGSSPSTGFVNLYRNAAGLPVTGKKVYATEAQANEKARPAQGWTKLRVLSISDYQAQMPHIEAAARKAGVEFADVWLNGKPVVAKKGKKTAAKKPAKRLRR